MPKTQGPSWSSLFSLSLYETCPCHRTMNSEQRACFSCSSAIAPLQLETLPLNHAYLCRPRCRRRTRGSARARAGDSAGSVAWYSWSFPPGPVVVVGWRRLGFSTSDSAVYSPMRGGRGISAPNSGERSEFLILDTLTPGHKSSRWSDLTNEDTLACR